MKLFICFVVLLTIASISADKDKKDGTLGSPYGGLSYGPAPSFAPSLAPSFGPAIAAAPCPKNYLFSCQPSLAPVACSSGGGAGGPAAGGASAGLAGAYSEYIPQYALPTPQYVYPQYGGVPQY